MFQHLFMDLLLHGEGGDGAGAAPGEAAPGAEASAETTPVAGENRRLTKAERRARAEQAIKAEQAQARPQPAKPAEQQTDTRIPYEEIKKMYPEIGKDIEAAVTGRVKNLHADVERRDKLLASMAKRTYGIEPGEDGKIDLDLIESQEHDQSFDERVQEFACENGVSDEFAAKAVKMEEDLAEKTRQLDEIRMEQKAREENDAMAALVQKHLREADEFRKIMPGFNLAAEVESNPLFKHLIVNCGVGVESAYYAAHHRELMAMGQQAAAIQAQRAAAASIQAGATMPSEGGLGRSPAADPGRAVDVSANWRELKRRHQRGEKVYL